MSGADLSHHPVSRQVADALDPWACQALIATLDRTGPDAQRPPCLWHWVYFRDAPPAAHLGGDGHPRVSHLLPSDLPPRRMFAGAEIEFHRPFEMGQPATLVETIQSITEKSGSSGRLVFVRLALRYAQRGVPCITEQRTIVYRDAPTVVSGAARAPTTQTDPAPRLGTVLHQCTVPETTLFRYSALTFNAHRIHYDRPYATEIEDYPGLVVHGPLLATLLADAGRDLLGAELARFEFRALAPIFANETFEIRGHLNGQQAVLYAYRPDGKIAIEATVRRG
jgi:3-methylfumaryl-CoA hydratase